MSVRKRSNGKWSALWREGNKQRSKQFDSQAEAEAFDKKIKCGTADVSPAAKATVRFDKYVTEIYIPRCGLSISSKTALNCAMNQLPTLAGQSLAWVASHRIEVQDAIAALTRKDHGILYQLVKKACDDAVANGYIDTHRLAGMKVKRVFNRRELILSTTQQRRAMADALGKRGLAVWIMHGTGCRIGEAIALRGSDFRDGFRTVRIQRKSYMGVAGGLKRKRDDSFRDVPVPSWLAKMVREHVAKHGLGALFPGTYAANDHGRSKGKPVKEFCSYNAVGPVISAAAAKVGLIGFTAHQFRHGFATAQLEAGATIDQVALWLGDMVKTVQDTYAHITSAMNEAAQDNVAMLGEDVRSRQRSYAA